MTVSTTPITADHDLAIVGGGLVGVSLALSLAEQGLRIVLIEAAAYQTEQPPSYDDRAIALSFGSRRIFEGMGLWQALASYATPIERIHVSDQGHFGVTRMDCREEHVDALGYVITARELGFTLLQQLQQVAQANSNLTIISPATLTELKLGQDHATLIIDRQGESTALTTNLVVAADGGNSPIRQQLGIEINDRDYQQTAIIANISTARPHQHVAYERFTNHGPLALLPMADDRCSLVWTRPPQDAERLLALSDAEFLEALQPCFGHRLGRFTKVGQRAAYPLHLIRAKEQVRERLALIGNAAHTLHPIAGQGFNLGLRDVAALAQCLADAQHQGEDIGQQSVLQGYALWRERDHSQVIGFTNTLVNTFSNRFPPLALARNLGLLATDIIPAVKHTLARHAMGLSGKLPRLARGLPL